MQNNFKGFSCACEHTTSKNFLKAVSKYLFMLSFSTIGGRFSLVSFPQISVVDLDP
jgi:hypothetical protein